MRVHETPSAANPRDVLLLHDWPNSGRVYEPLAQKLRLAAPDLRLFAPDLRGYGDSDKPGAGYTCARFVADVQNIADALNLSDYLLVGHSMSGKIAQAFAATRPAGLSRLALLTPGLLAPSPPVDVSGRVAAWGDRQKTSELVWGFAARPLSQADAEMLADDGLRVGEAAWRGWLETMRGEDLLGAAASIAVPTLVIGGGRDPQRSEEELRAGVVEAIAGAQYARLATCGHLPHLEDPLSLAALLVNFLDGVEA